MSKRRSVANGATGTHFRYGLITWALQSPDTDPNTFTFTINFVWRRTFFSQSDGSNTCSGAGATIDLYAASNLNYFLVVGTTTKGKTAYLDVRSQKVTSLDLNQDWCAATWTGSSVTTVTTRTVYHTQQARLNELQNNGGEYWYLQSTVVQYPSITKGMITNSPTSSGLPIVSARNGLINTWTVPSGNQNTTTKAWTDQGGNPITFRMSTLSEELGNSQSSNAVLCPNLSINSTTGTVTFNTIGFTGSRIYQTQHMISNGAGAIPIDYIISTSDPTGVCTCNNNKVCTTDSQCSPNGCGCSFSNPIVVTADSAEQTSPYTPPAYSGTTVQPMSFIFVADDTVLTSAVSIQWSGLPVGASLSSPASCSDGTCPCTNNLCNNPQYTRFTWQNPVSGTYSICFGVTQYATSPATNLANGQYCVTLSVSTQCNNGTVLTSNSVCNNPSTFTPSQCCSCSNAGFDPASRCTSCRANFYGPNCTPCPTCNNGTCSDGLQGDGTCTCNNGWQGVVCSVPKIIPCDPNAVSYIQNQVVSTGSITPVYANLYMAVNAQSQGSASINFTINAPASPSLDLVILQDTSAKGDITPLQTNSLCTQFMSNLISNFPKASAGLASVNNWGNSYRRMGILTSSSDTFCSYASQLSNNGTGTLSQTAVYEAITSIVKDNYGWASNSYKVIAVITAYPPTGTAWSTALASLATLGINVLFYAQTSSTYSTYSNLVASNGFGSALNGGSGTSGNLYYSQIPTEIKNNLVQQTKAYTVNDVGFFSGSSNGNTKGLGTSGWSQVNFVFPSTYTKGQVLNLPLPTVSVMGWGTATVQIVLNRAPVSQNAYFTPTQDSPFSFDLTGSDADNNVMVVKWVTLPNNASLISAATGKYISQNVYYNFSTIYQNTPFYRGPSMGQFQLWDGCDPSAIYNATFAIQPTYYNPYTTNYAGSVRQGASLTIDFTPLIGSIDPTVTKSSLTVVIATVPAQGQLLDSNNNVLRAGSQVTGNIAQVTYSAAIVNNNYFYGPYNFTFYCYDAHKTSNTSLASIRVDFVNHAPVLTASPVTVAIGASTSFSVTVNDVDNPDYSIFNSTYTNTSSHFTSFTYANGAAQTSVPNSAATFYLNNTQTGGSVTYTAVTDDYVTGSLGVLTVTARDSYGGVSTPVTVPITAAANRAPTLTSWSNTVTMTTADVSKTITVTGGDPDGYQGAKLVFLITGYPSNGKINTQSGSLVPSALPSGGWPFSISERTNNSVARTSTYSYVYTPNDYFYGTDTLQFGVQDVLGLTTVATVTVSVPFKNHPPQINGPSSAQGAIGSTANFTFTVLDKDVPDNVTVLLSTYQLTSVTQAYIGVSGSNTLTPFTSTSGVLVLQGPPSATYVVVLQLDDSATGSLGAITLAALDKYNQLALTNLTVSISGGKNNNPYFVNPTSFVSLKGSDVTVPLNGSDVDGHQGASLTITFLRLPSNGQVYLGGSQITSTTTANAASSSVRDPTPSVSSFSFRYVPNAYTFGNDSVSVYLTDPLNGVSTTLVVTISVPFVNHAPTLSAPANIGCAIGQNCTLSLTLSDPDTIDTLTLVQSGDTITAASVSATFFYYGSNSARTLQKENANLPRTTTVYVILQITATASGNIGSLSFYARDLSNANSTVVNTAVTVSKNQPPFMLSQNPANPITLLQNATQTITLVGRDNDSGQGNTLSISFSVLPVNGTLTLNGAAVSAGQTFPSTSAFATDTVQNTTTFQVVYTPKAYHYGNDSFSLSFTDIGGASSPFYPIEESVTFVNTPPTLTTRTSTVVCSIGAKCPITFYVSDPDTPESESVVFADPTTLNAFVTDVSTIYNGVTSSTTATVGTAARSGMSATSTVQVVLTVGDNAVGSLGKLTLYAQDSHGGASSSVTVDITAGVDTPPFVVYAPATVTVVADGIVYVNLTASDVDGNQGANLTFTLLNAPNHGQITTGRTNSSVVSSTTFASTENTVSSAVISGQTLGTSTYGFYYSPTQYYSGSDSLTFYFTDALGGSTATQTIQLNVTFVNHPPLLFTSASQVICSIGGLCTLTFSAVDYDPRDSLSAVLNTFSLVQVTGVTAAYTITVNNITATALGLAVPAKILTPMAITSQFTVTIGFTSNIIGNLGTISLTAMDSYNANSSVVTVSLQAAASTAPYLTNVSTPALSKRASDTSSYVLHVLEDGSVTFTLTGSDDDGNQGGNLTLVVTSTVSNGALTAGGNNVASGNSLPLTINSASFKSTPPTSSYGFTYTPTKLYFGRDTFSFVWVDSVGTRSVVYSLDIAITHVNHPPTGNNFVVSGMSGFNTSLANRFSAADVDGDKLQLNVSRLPSKGTVHTADGTLVSVGQLIDQADWNGIYYNCLVQEYGNDTITFSFFDGSASSPIYQGELQIALSDRAPVTANVTVQLNMNTIVNFTLNATNLNDGQVNVLTLHISETAQGSICLESQLVHCLTAGSIYRGENTVLFYNPPVGEYSPEGVALDTVTYYATNPAGSVSNVAQVNFQVAYTNEPPVPNIPTLLTVYEASYTQFVLDASDDHTPSNQLRYYLKSGPSNGVLQLAAGEAGELPTNFTAGDATTYPASLNGESKIVSFYPFGFDYGDNYAHFVITVLDLDNAATDVNITVNVVHVNQAPVLVYDSLTFSGLENATIIISFNGTDIDSPASSLVGTVTKLPQRGSLYTCIYNAETDNCTAGELLVYKDNTAATVPHYNIVNNVTMFKAVFVPVPSTSQLVYAVPSFNIYDDVRAVSNTFTPKIRVIAVNQPPTLGYRPEYATLTDAVLPLPNVTVADPDAGNIAIYLKINVTSGVINITSEAAHRLTRNSACNFTTTTIECTASQSTLRAYLLSLSFTPTDAGNHTVQLYVNDLGAGADTDRKDISHLSASGSFSIIVTAPTVPAPARKDLTWVVGVGSAAGAISAAAAVALVAKLIKKPDDEIFNSMLDFDSAGVVDNPLYIQQETDKVNPLYEED
ncbi:hypothetical protein PROFUN_03015 [Planoprotostelium fungivorum]|uniref:EGF-like domain-containing protein n=1 Tax=Planoprotostelium fungivorum TaxID=1890364 RepID=A0A2P6NXB9_9EUKA|nr:hypothetical protein PROFUN_03015 [Planoprotostelium fungivorum]